MSLKTDQNTELNGWPMKKGGKLANKRYQMNDVKYKKAGGTVAKPTL